MVNEPNPEHNGEHNDDWLYLGNSHKKDQILMRKIYADDLARAGQIWPALALFLSFWAMTPDWAVMIYRIAAQKGGIKDQIQRQPEHGRWRWRPTTKTFNLRTDSTKQYDFSGDVFLYPPTTVGGPWRIETKVIH